MNASADRGQMNADEKQIKTNAWNHLLLRLKLCFICAICGSVLALKSAYSGHDERSGLYPL